MINIIVDEGYAFDLLSILKIKSDFYPDKNLNTYNNLFDSIKSQIGAEKFNTIIESDFYLELLVENRNMWDIISQINNGVKVDGIEINTMNSIRHEKKRNLQKHFFDSELTENKYN